LSGTTEGRGGNPPFLASLPTAEKGEEGMMGESVGVVVVPLLVCGSPFCP